MKYNVVLIYRDCSLYMDIINRHNNYERCLFDSDGYYQFLYYDRWKFINGNLEKTLVSVNYVLKLENGKKLLDKVIKKLLTNPLNKLYPDEAHLVDSNGNIFFTACCKHNSNKKLKITVWRRY